MEKVKNKWQTITDTQAYRHIRPRHYTMLKIINWFAIYATTRKITDLTHITKTTSSYNEKLRLTHHGTEGVIYDLCVIFNKARAIRFVVVVHWVFIISSCLAFKCTLSSTSSNYRQHPFYIFQRSPSHLPAWHESLFLVPRNKLITAFSVIYNLLTNIFIIIAFCLSTIHV